jgi:predicted TIM-barrel fold metal-dependent hydrolase
VNINDAHCHFFSTTFFAALGGDAALTKLGWEPPGAPAALADRWAAELDRHHVSRAALIASAPGDAGSVARAIERHPNRFVGFFMADPTRDGAAELAAAAIERDRLRAICLFPAMHRFHLHDDRAQALVGVAAAHPGTAVFVHCGVLSVGVRRRLGLPSAFDIRFGNPLDLHAVANRYPQVPMIIPHFGAGLFREALMVADLCPNVLFDTSSSNSWIKYHPGLTLAEVFRRALEVMGPARLLFGSDSSFFPRGWVKEVYDQQSAALEEIGASADVKRQIFGANFSRVFP